MKTLPPRISTVGLMAIREDALHDVAALLQTARRREGDAPPAKSMSRHFGAETGTRIALVAVHGVIMPRLDWEQWDGVVSSEGIARRVSMAARDDSVSAIVLDIDSPGGAVMGVPEAGAAIRAAAEVKPVIALAHHEAASAAYWLASQASELRVTPSGHVGSVGVIATHIDMKEWFQGVGIKWNLVTAGEHKAEFHYAQELSDGARAELQRRVDARHTEFLEVVAAGRGVTTDVVREQFGKGRMLLAKDALGVGMVDGIATLDQVLAELVTKQDGTLSSSDRATSDALREFAVHIKQEKPQA